MTDDAVGSDDVPLEPDHPKLEAFQSAVRAHLLKRLEQTREEAAQLRKENAEKKKIRLEKTQELHEAQRILQVCLPNVAQW